MQVGMWHTARQRRNEFRIRGVHGLGACIPGKHGACKGLTRVAGVSEEQRGGHCARGQRTEGGGGSDPRSDFGLPYNYDEMPWEGYEQENMITATATIISKTSSRLTLTLASIFPPEV